MAIDLQPTPVLTGESAKRFTKILFSNRNKKVGIVPTPELEALTRRIMERQREQESLGQK